MDEQVKLMDKNTQETDELPQFTCIACGECCRHIHLVPELAHLQNGDGICKHLKNDKCDIYHNRPDVCNYIKLYKNFNKKGDMVKNSEFFISVPNLLNKNIKTDEEGRFTYDYKYGRNAGEIQEYVKVVPFNKTNISIETISRFKTAIPTTFEMIKNFNQTNKKIEKIVVDNRIN